MVIDCNSESKYQIALERSMDCTCSTIIMIRKLQDTAGYKLGASMFNDHVLLMAIAKTLDTIHSINRNVRGHGNESAHESLGRSKTSISWQ